MKKHLLLAMSALLCLGAVACSSGGGDVDQDLPEDDPTSEQEIIFWHCLGHAKTTNLEKIQSAFNTKYAGKYKVSLVHLAGDYDGLHDAVKTKLAAGEVPALTMGYPDSFSEYISNDIADSQILRLDNFIKDANFGYSETEVQDFVPGYYSEGTSYQFTGTWSMPMYKSTEVMYYNANYFKGVNPQNMNKFKNNAEFKALYNKADGKDATDADLKALEDWLKANSGYVYDLPTSWTDMVTVARKMIADRTTEQLKDEFYPFGYDSDANMMISQMEQRGISYTVNSEEAQADATKHFTFVNDDAKALLNEMVGLINDKVMITKGSLGGSTYTNTYFNDGKLAMTVGSTGGSSYNISENFKVKLAPVPYSNNNAKYIQQGPSICFFDNSNAYIHKGAWLFYKELAAAQANADLALENSYDPIRISSYETESYKTWISKAGQGLKYDIPSITSTLKNNYFTSPTFVGSGTARTEIGSLISYVVNNKYTTDKAFDYAYNRCIQAVA